MSERELDELESSLRSLFDDERLAVRPAPGATAGVVAGARRVRRRRQIATAASGAGVAAVAVIAGLLIGMPASGDGSNVAAPQTSQTLDSATSVAKPSTRPSRTKQTSASDEIETSGSQDPLTKPMTQPPSEPLPEDLTAPMQFGGPIGPSGWDRLTLGMSFEEAKATGLIAADAAAPAGCTSYTLTSGTDQVNTVDISESGLERFTASGGRSPEGMGNGSTLEELQKAYPSGSVVDGAYIVSSGDGNGLYRFAMGDDSVTDVFTLSNGGNCEPG